MSNWTWRAVFGLCVLTGWLALPATVAAQAAADAPEAAAGDGDAESKSADAPSIMQMTIDSGPTGWAFMAVLLAFSIVGTMVAIERATKIRHDRLLPPEFVRRLEDATVGRRATLEELRRAASGCDAPAANILSAALLRAGRPLPEVEKAMEDAVAREMSAIRGGIRPLNVIGNIAPLVGLLGTVVGMISAFYTASAGGLGGKGESLAQGIYLALLTTAAGLAIAIPALLLAAWFNSRVERTFREIDQHLMETMPSFDALEAIRRERSTTPAAERELATAEV